jgi:hypothetical protein
VAVMLYDLLVVPGVNLRRFSSLGETKSHLKFDLGWPLDLPPSRKSHGKVATLAQI